MNKQDFIKLGGKEWNNHGKERVYITAAIYKEHFFPASALSDKSNKFFYDCKTNALMRSYKGKKPTVEFQY